MIRNGHRFVCWSLQKFPEAQDSLSLDPSSRVLGIGQRSGITGDHGSSLHPPLPEGCCLLGLCFCWAT